MERSSGVGAGTGPTTFAVRGLLEHTTSVQRKLAIPSVWGNQETISISGNLIAYDGEVVQGCSIQRVGHGN